MSARKRRDRARLRIGRVSVYWHHGAWWVYNRDGGQAVRRKVASSRECAEQITAQVNAQLATGAPSLLGFSAVTVTHLRVEFLEHHKHVLQSTMATVRRYRAATQHLANFVEHRPAQQHAHVVKADAFARYLRELETAPNGHPNAKKRRLRDKGVRFILEACRSMFAYAMKRRYLPPYAGNPFAELPIDRLRTEDAKRIFVFDERTELAFLRSADAWSFPLHFTLAKTGLRVSEATHLLLEDLDLSNGWLHVRNKPALGWRVKTGTERVVPLIAEVVAVLAHVVGHRRHGPVFLRRRFVNGASPALVGCQAELEQECEHRQEALGPSLSRTQAARVARTIWRDAGAVKADAVRSSFIRIMRAVGRADATCPKSWRHTFATLLQDANVDPLVRQLVLGH